MCRAIQRQVYSLFEAARTGRWGPVQIGQTNAKSACSDAWLSMHGKLDSGPEGGTNAGSVMDCRPAFELHFGGSDVVHQIDVCLLPELEKKTAGENPGHLTDVDGDEKFPSVDLGELFDEMSLCSLDPLLRGYTLKVLKAIAEPDLSLEFSLLVGNHLELVMGRLEPDEEVRLFRVRLLSAEVIKQRTLVRDYGTVDTRWVENVLDLIATNRA